MHHLQLSLCGPMRVRLDERELPEPALGAKPLALLAYLAVERGTRGHGGHTRDALTTLLWGEFPEAQARASFRQALAHLRRALGDVVVIERQEVALAARVTLDVSPLLDDAPGDGAGRESPSAPADVLALEPARFLAGLRVQRGGGFEEWAESMRAVLRRRHAALLGEAARDAAARLDWTAAAHVATRWRDADPLGTEATQALMEAHHFAGHDGDAMAAFAAHRAALADATGEAPAQAVRQLAARIARAASTASGNGAAFPTPPMGVPAASGALVHAPLVGRAREWSALAAAWRDARAGAGRVVVIEGEPGAGKSRLAGDFARRAGADGATVLHGRSRETSATIPFSVAAALLRSALDAPGFAAVDGEWLAEVARLVPELRAALPGVPVAPRAALADEWRLYEGAVQLVAALAVEHPLLVVLDDVQWCDAASAGVVRTLVERSEAMPVLWCVALRSGGAEWAAPGMRLASALAAGQGATSLPLAPLGDDDMHALLVALGGDATHERVRALATRLHGLTGGMPGVALEAVRVLRAARALEDGAGGWLPGDALAADARLSAVLDAPSVAAPMRDRLMRLGEDGRAVLLTITLAGGPCTPALLSEVHGVSRLRAAAIGDALVERALAREHEGAYRVANGLVADAVRHWGSAARRAEVERALGAARVAGEREPGVRGGALPPPRGTGEWRSSV